MKENLTYIALIVDRSGSMASIKRDMEGALATFLAEQREVPGDCLVSLYQFDQAYEPVFEHQPIANVPPITIAPRGTTALHDAMGKTIRRVGHYLASLPEAQRPSRVLVITITDGFENASVEYHGLSVRKLVQQQQDDYSWAFTFLGADQNAVLVGTTLGVAATSSLGYGANSAGTHALTTTLSNATTRFRSAVAGSGFGYTDDERHQAESTKKGSNA